MATADEQTNEVYELLPWYVNGTLSEEENDRVRVRIDHAEELRAEAAETDALLKALVDDVRVPPLTDARVAAVMDRLDEVPEDDGKVVNLLDRPRGGPRRSPFALTRALPLALAAACALVAVIVYVPQTDPGNGEYTTLYEDRPLIPVAVELTEDVGAAEAQALFAELAVSDAAPQPDGTYRLELPEETTVAELYRILTALRADDRVVRAEALTVEEE